VNTTFNPGDLTYHVSDERLREFQKLTPEQRLKWVEELAIFLRLAKAGGKIHPLKNVRSRPGPFPHSDVD